MHIKHISTFQMMEGAPKERTMKIKENKQNK